MAFAWAERALCRIRAFVVHLYAQTVLDAVTRCVTICVRHVPLDWSGDNADV